MTISVTENKLLMGRARQSLKDKWALAVGVFFTSFILPYVLAWPIDQVFGTPVDEKMPSVGDLAGLLIIPAIWLGTSSFYLAVARGENSRYSQMFNGFRKFIKALATFWLFSFYVFLWTLLLVVPGILAALSYSQAFFILADEPSVGVAESIRRSKALMQGHRWKFVLLHLRFLGWILLGIVTLGIGFLWIAPYYNVSLAHFYDDVKRARSGAV